MADQPLFSTRDQWSDKSGYLTRSATLFIELLTRRILPLLSGNATEFLNGTGAFTTPAAGAPTNAEYLVATANGTLSAERVTTDTATVTWDHGTAAQAKANVPNDAITNAKLANMADSAIKGRAVGAGAGDPTDLDADDVSDILDTAADPFVRTSAAGSGSSVVVQVVNTQTGAVNTGTTTIPVDDTIPQNTEGDEYMTLAITPTDSSNKLRIDVVIHLATSAAPNSWVAAALFQDTTANALAVGFQTVYVADGNVELKFTHYMTAGTTSSTTFKVRAGANGAGTTTFNGRISARLYGGVSASSITITEIIP